MPETVRAQKRKDVATAVLLNFFIPGAGYAYAQRYVIAVAVFGLLFFGLVLTVILPPLGLNLVALLSVVGAIDGYLTVKKYNSQIDDREQASLVTCPNCAEKIQPAAKVCRFCQREIQAATVGA